MKRKIFSVLFALVLVCSFSLVTAVPAAAQSDDWYVDDSAAAGGDGMSWGTAFQTIPEGVDTAVNGDTIFVAEGDYVGATVNEDLTIIGAAGGASIITSGPYYEGGHPTAKTAFLLDAEADGAEIRNFTINCDASVNFYFGVFARGADNVIVDSLIINHTVQGISNWGGSNWQITNNVIDNTEAAGGGGIAIFLGAEPKEDLRICSYNLVQYNRIIGDGATATTYTCPGISLCLDARDFVVTEAEELTGNQILDNTIAVTNVTGGVGIEVDVIGVGDDSDNIAAVMTKAPIHDNTIKGNTIDGPWQGMLFINVTNLIVEENEITSCCGEAIVVEKGHSGIAIHNNNIYGNGTDTGTVYSGVYNDDTVVDYGSLNAENNWWGTKVESEIQAMVSPNVDFSPWLGGEWPSSTVGLTATPPREEIGISVLPSEIDFGAIEGDATVDGAPLMVTNIGTALVDVSAEMTTDTKYDDTYFYTAALRLNGEPSDIWENPTIFGAWTAAKLLLAPIAVEGSEVVTTGLVCPDYIRPGGTYTGTILFVATLAE